MKIIYYKISQFFPFINILCKKNFELRISSILTSQQYHKFHQLRLIGYELQHTTISTKIDYDSNKLLLQQFHPYMASNRMKI